MSTNTVLGTILMVFLASIPVFAQGNTGRILGVVADQSSGNVASASVTIVDVERGVTRNLTTDADGAYVATSLLPGTYTVKVEFKRFRTFVPTVPWPASFRIFDSSITIRSFANPWGGTSGYRSGAFTDPSTGGTFGCGCATPDGASVNPVLGSGSARTSVGLEVHLLAVRADS